MSFFRSLQDSQFTDWFLGSDSIWTYPLVLTLHTVGLAVLVGASVVIHLRLLDVGSNIPLARFRPLYRLIWYGFGLNLVTGVILFISQAADRVGDPVFYVKLGGIAVALGLGARARRTIVDAPAPSVADRSQGKWVALVVLASWTVAIVAGRLVAYLGG